MTPLSPRLIALGLLLLLPVLPSSSLSAPGSEAAAPDTATPGVDAVDSADTIDADLEQRTSLADDPATTSLFPGTGSRFRSWREKVSRDLDIETILSYDTLVQGYVGTSSQGGGAGELGIRGRWLMFGRSWNRPVYLSLFLRHRHAYGSDPPSALARETGLLWNTVKGFSDTGFQVPELYISQESLNGLLVLRYGQFSIDNFFDSNSLRSAKRYFLNQMFSGNPSVGFPDFGAGVTAQWRSAAGWDLSAGLSNIQQIEQRREINLDFASTAMFAVLQGGMVFQGLSDREARLQVMTWSSQDNDEERSGTGNGLSITLEHEGEDTGQRYLLRLAASNGDTAPVDLMLALAWGRETGRHNRMGAGLGIGRSRLDHRRLQAVGEFFYQRQIAKELTVCPDLQVIVGRGTGLGEGFQVVAGLRVNLRF